MFAQHGLFQETHQDADKAHSKVHGDAAAQCHTQADIRSVIINTKMPEESRNSYC